MRPRRLFWILLFPLTGQFLHAHVYYVNSSGSNANPGTRSQPWATPGYGARQLHPGDTLILCGGRYLLREYDADIIIPRSGNAGAWITIRGESGNRPVLVGRDNLLTAIDLSGKSYVRIENLEITHDETASGDTRWFREGIEVLGEPGHHLVFQNLYIHHLDEFGMNLQDVQDVAILSYRIEYCGFGALGGPLGEHGGWRNVTIREGSLSFSGHYYQGGDGSNRPYDRPDGFGIEPSAGPVLIENVRAEHNFGDGLDSKASNTTIRRCIVANNSCDGVKLWGPNSRIENTLIYGRGDGHPEPTPWAAIVIAPEEQANARFEILHVTVDDALGQNYLMYVQYDYPHVPVEVIIRNTIFSARGPRCPIYLNPAGRLVLEHTLYFPQCETLFHHGEARYTCADLASLGSGNLCGDPRFVQTAWGTEGDYHLQEGSPAIDGGAMVGALETDLDGRLRDAHPDLGAYEYAGGVGICPHSKPYSGSWALYPNFPNPFNATTIIPFYVPFQSPVQLTVFDGLGREVRRLVDFVIEPGEHHVFFDARDLSTGIYFYQVKTAFFVETRKALFMK